MKRHAPAFRSITDAAVAHRRRALVDLIETGQAHRMSVRELAQLLGTAGVVNPTTRKAYSHNTIAKDLQWLEQAWRAESVREITEHKSEHLQLLRGLYRRAMSPPRPPSEPGEPRAPAPPPDVEAARRILKDIAELLGLNAPQVLVFEQVERAMADALTRLESAFSGDEATLERVYQALLGEAGAAAPEAADLN